MEKKLKIGLIFGGRSGEHEVSLAGAWHIYNALDKKKYNVNLIGIDKNGVWHLGEPKSFWVNPESIKTIKLNTNTPEITAVNKNGKTYLMKLEGGKLVSTIDVFFLKTSGTFGEDGCLQGFLELLNVAYVGSGVLGSAIGMDKDVTKRLLRDSGISIGKFYSMTKWEVMSQNIKKIIKILKFPIFVKPANLGSSVGISKAHNKKELDEAINFAFQFDNKIVLEEFIQGREIECSVLGNENPIASHPGEIKLMSEFYSYAAKYLDDKVSTPTPKADLDKKTVGKIQDLAIKVFKVLNCEGMGRVDFFLTQKGKLYVNEINTLPGFTSISMYPKMFEESGISYSKLLDKLIQLAIARKKRNERITRDFKL